MSNNLKDCPLGNYCEEGSSAEEIKKCLSGTFNNRYNAESADDCKPCLAGQFCGLTGLYNTSGPCEQGYYCIAGAKTDKPQLVVNTDTDKYGPCPAGYYCPVGTSYPIPCPAGTYSPDHFAISSATCKSCPVGYYCPLSGQASPYG